MDKRSTYVNKLDKIMSRIIRLSATDEEWFIKCYTCGRKVERKKAHCAHFIERGCYKHRRNPDNLEACCNYCNTYNKQEHIRVYTLKKVKQFGIQRVELMQGDKKKVDKIYTAEIGEQIIRRKTELDMLEAEKAHIL